MSILSIIGTAATFATDIVEKILPDRNLSEQQKAVATQQIANMIAGRDEALIETSKQVILAELQQGDTFTKRARPAIIYVGLLAVVFNHMLIPFFNRIAEWIAIAKGTSLEAFGGLTPMTLPSDFWYVWGGVASVWIIGRSAEKKGANNKLVNMIVGK